jgi:GntR family transcriptional regulator
MARPTTAPAAAGGGPRKDAPRRPTWLLARERDGVPKYLQLASILEERIARGEYELEDRIPTEDRLCQEYQVSRITVREAVDRLVQKGLVERRQGKGTYVVAGKLRRNIAKVYSFSHDMVHLGLRPSSVVLLQAVERASPDVAAVLRLPEADRRVTRIERVRKANGAAILIERTLVPTRLCPGLERVDLAAGSLYEALTRRHAAPQTAEETYEAIILRPEDARRLGYAGRRPRAAFAIQRVTYLADGTPIELTRAVGRGDRLTLGIHMVADQADFQRLVGVTPGP